MKIMTGKNRRFTVHDGPLMLERMTARLKIEQYCLDASDQVLIDEMFALISEELGAVGVDKLHQRLQKRFGTGRVYIYAVTDKPVPAPA